MKNKNTIKQLVLSKEQVDSVIALYSSGKINEAIDAIKVLNENYPNVPLLYNILGACYKTLGQLEASIKMFETAVAIKPDYAEVYNNLGITHMQLRQLDAAVNSYEKAIAIQLDFAEAHNNLGITLKELGQLNAAVKSYEKALAIKPDFAEAYNNLGNALKDLGQLDEAVTRYEQTLDIKPDFAEAHNNLGNVFKDLGQLDAAVESYKKAIAIKPDFTEAHNNLGIALKDHGQLDIAVESYKKAIAIKPDYHEAHNNLGIVLKELGQLDAAVESYKKALAIKPDYAEAFNNLGITLVDLGELNVAVNCYEKALAIKPDYVYALNSLGNVLNDLGQLDNSVKSYEKAIAIEPNFVEAHINLGNVFRDLKRLDEALASYDHAFVLNPDLGFILGNILPTRMSFCNWDNLSNHLNELTKKINNNEKTIGPFDLLSLIDDPELQRKVTEMYANKKYLQSNVLPKIELYPKHKKIRIGYFSADFRIHPVSHLTAELYEIHDRNQFEIYAFSFGPDTKDEMNLRIKIGVDHFHDVRTMSHKEVAMLSRSLEIDIAVDLGGFTQRARTGIFAMSAAPIQISYIGYPGTMGANYYDYLLADQTIIPKKNQKYFSEKIAYLPSYQVNDSTQSPPEIFFTRQDLGLPETGFVFCCFNNTYKITPTTFDGWGRILEQVDGSVLLIYANSESTKLNLTKEIVLRGIDPSRLIFGERLSKDEYLARYQVADLFLDTLPYNAGTTASDALRMGLPVLTCMGRSFISRYAASLLNAVNLPELITTTQEQYESLAIELATNPEKLKIIKDKLVDNLPTAPLYDTQLFARHLESAYLTMYNRYQQGLDPDYIYVEL